MESAFRAATNHQGSVPAYLRIETGDDHNNILYFRVDEIALLSIMNYVDEKEAAQKAQRERLNSGIIMPGMQRVRQG